jgi:DNA segregation ATPase FtsK/SpoIIIE and related proteins
MKQQHINEIKAIVLFAFALIIFVSLVSYTPSDLPFYSSHPNSPAKNFGRIFGAYLSGALIFAIGKWSAYFIALFLVFWAWNKLSGREFGFRLTKVISFIGLFLVLSTLFSISVSQVDGMRFERGGFVGLILGDYLIKYFGKVVAYIILITGAVSFTVIIGEFLISPWILKAPTYFAGFLSLTKSIFAKRKEKSITLTPRVKPAIFPSNEKQKLNGKEGLPVVFEKKEPKIEIKTPAKLSIREAKPTKEVAKEPRIVGEYHLPTLDLLDDPPPLSSRQIKEDLMGNAKILEETLADFGVSVHVADIERGPVITRYELEPAPGVKVQKITTLSDDIALAMKAHSVRIVAPIPGKSRVGIEVPNSHSSIVYLKEVLSCDEYRNAGSKLTLALGKGYRR